MKQYELFDFNEIKGKRIIKIPSISMKLSNVFKKNDIDNQNYSKIKKFKELINNDFELKKFIKEEILAKNYKGNKFVFNFNHNIVIFNFDKNGFLVEVEVNDSKWIYDFSNKKFKRIVISKFSKIETHFGTFKELLRIYFEAKKEYIPDIKLSKYEEFLME